MGGRYEGVSAGRCDRCRPVSADVPREVEFTECGRDFLVFFFFSSRRRHTRSVSAFLLNRSSDLADIAFDADPKFFACLVRFESSSVPTTLPTAYDVYPLDGRHDGGCYTVKDCVTIDVLPRTPGNNVYVGFMVWSNFTATKCRGLVSLNQVIKEIICLQPLK